MNMNSDTPRTDAELTRIENDERQYADRHDCYVALLEFTRQLERELAGARLLFSESQANLWASQEREVRLREELAAMTSDRDSWCDQADKAERELAVVIGTMAAIKRDRDNVHEAYSAVRRELAALEEHHAWEISPAMAQARIDQLLAENAALNGRVKELVQKAD